MNFSILVEKAISEASHKAGELQMKYFHSDLYEEKKESISSIVTEVDKASEGIIIDIIQSYFPGHNVLSEECGFIDQHSEFTWIIDPLDGTSNYAAKLPWFGSLICLLKNNKPLIAGANIPFSQELFIAKKDEGAFLNGKRIRCGEKKLSDSLFVFSTDYSSNKEYLENGLLVYEYLVQNARNVRTTNSLLDLLYVAKGNFGGCINLYNCIWDIAATSLIIEEAGAVIKTLNNKNLEFSIDTNSINRNYGIACANNTIMKSIEPLLKLKVHE